MSEQDLNNFNDCRGKFFEYMGPRYIVRCAAFPFGVPLPTTESINNPIIRSKTAEVLGCMTCPFAKDVFAISIVSPDGKSIGLTPICNTEQTTQLPNEE